MKSTWLLSDINQTQQNRVFPEVSPVVEGLLLARGIDTDEKKQQYLMGNYDHDLGDPLLLKDMVKAVERITQAKKDGETVCVYGDYDADGVTASVLVKELLEMAGINSFGYIPDRLSEGYGLNNSAIDYIKDKEATLIVTVDCGISNAAQVDYAKQKGIDMIILDHHHVPPNIPQAVAVVDPKQQDDQYPEKELAGVGVAFKFAQAAASGLGVDLQQLKWMLDLVAIGTIADCVPLLGENRTLVRYGLIVLAKTKRVGLKQLYQVGRIAISDHELPTSHQVAFHIAPRINAAGRMDHANTAYELLCCDPTQVAEARVLALELEAKNQQRQKVTKVIVEEIQKRIEQKTTHPSIIIETDAHWELGVIGLAAGKIADRYHRPVILLKQEGESLRGSGRSIPAFNLIETLERHRDVLSKYGGHRQAAGILIEGANLAVFRERMAQEADQLTETDLARRIMVDMKLDFCDITPQLLSELVGLEPFGQENREPVFSSHAVQLVEMKVVGNGSKHLKLWLKQECDPSKRILEAIGFGLGEQFPDLAIGDRLDVVYTLAEDTWNGSKKVQMRVIDLDRV